MSKEIDMSTEKPNPLVQLVDPNGDVVTLKRHSMPKNADGSLRLKAGWRLHDGTPIQRPAKKK